MTEAVAKGPGEAIAQSEAHINDFLLRGGADTEAEDVEVGEKSGVAELIRAAWANAKETEKAWLEQAANSRPAEEPKPERPKEVVKPKPFPSQNLGQSTSKPQPAPKPAEPRKTAADIFDKRPTTKWPEEWPAAPLPPSDARGFERLLYPRGLLGHAVQFVMDTAPLPDRKLALAVALSACAKGLDRKVIGPSDNSTILFNLVIAETGAGKHHGISCSRALLRAMGIENSIVASGLASVQAVEEIIEGNKFGCDPNPNALVVVDEVGSWLTRILSKSQGGNVSEIPGILQTLWGQPLEDAWIGTKKVGKEMKTFFAVAFSIIGFSTEKMFFRALEDRLVSSGFVNRMLLFNVGRGALERVDPKYSWTQCPEWLVKAFRHVTALTAAPLDAPMKLTLPAKNGGTVLLRDFHRLEWGPGAKERWRKFDNSVRAMPSVDDRELWIRAPDLAVRLATIVAVYRCSRTVDVEDWEWAVEIAKHSTEQLRRGVDKYMLEELEQADLAERIRDYVRERKGELVSIGQISKAMERKIGDVRKLNEVIWHVASTGDIIHLTKEEVEQLVGVRPGRPTTYFIWGRK
jgi:hypothetical protein